MTAFLQHAPLTRERGYDDLTEAEFDDIGRTLDALREDVERTRSQGYTLSLDDATIGIGALAFPVLGADGALLGCLSVAGRSVDVRERQQEFTDAARAAVAELTSGATSELATPLS